MGGGGVRGVGGRREESLKLTHVSWNQLNIITPFSSWVASVDETTGQLERVRREEREGVTKLEFLQTLSSCVGSGNETTGFDKLLELCFLLRKG